MSYVVVGNVRGILVRDDVSYELSRLHMSTNDKEKQRVLKAGANLNHSDRLPRVNGVLATTRGLGNHGDPDLKKAVIVDPHTMTVRWSGWPFTLQ